MKHNIKHQTGFSLVEVLAAVGIIGIIAFLAIPNIVAIKEDSERQLAISRAEGVNMGVAAYIQANGLPFASANWGTADTEVAAEARYELIRPYLSFAPRELEDFQPAGFIITPPINLQLLEKAELKIIGETEGFDY